MHKIIFPSFVFLIIASLAILDHRAPGGRQNFPESRQRAPRIVLTETTRTPPRLPHEVIDDTDMTRREYL